MYRLEKDFRFEAAHRLPQHDGKCARLHGHSWRGTLMLEDTLLQVGGPKDGMLVDFGDVSAALAPVLDAVLDHHDLNVTTGLSSPTSENLAAYLFFTLKPALPMLVAVRIEETCTSRCEFRP